MDQTLANLLENRKSLLALFPSEAIDLDELRGFIINCVPTDVIAAEGRTLNLLFIPLTKALEISVQKQATKVGRVEPGRSFSLHHFLRGLPAPYSLIANVETQVLAIPRTYVEKLLASYPFVKNYLVKVTENAHYRDLSKDLNSLGVSDEFRVAFVSSLREVEFGAHHSLVTPGEQATSVHLLIEGQFLKRTAQAGKSIAMPNKSWLGWDEFSSGKNFDYSVFTAAKSRSFTLDAEVLEQLKITFTDDFVLLDKLVRYGEFHQADEDDSADEKSIEELFEGSVKQKKWHVKYPWVAQNDQMDCGPACLSMLSHFFGKELSVPFWRAKLSTNREGTSLFDMASTTNRYGFISHCLEVSDLKEIDSFLLPFVALRKNHYFVVYKINSKGVLLGDPAVGIREMPINEFMDGLQPAGLFLKPTVDFEVQADSPSPWKFYLPLMKGLELDFIFAAICATIVVILSLAPPFISQVLLDDVLVQKNDDLFWILIGSYSVVTILSSFVSWAESYYFIHIMNKFNFRATSVFVQKMFSLPYDFFATRHVGDFTHRLAELGNLRQFVTSTLLGVFLNLLTIFIYGAALLMMDFKLGLAVLAVSPLILILPLVSSSYLSRIYGDIFNRNSEQSSLLTDFIKGIAVIKSTGAELTSRLRFENKLVDLLKVQNQFSRKSLQVEALTSGFHQALNVAALGLCVFFG